MTVAVSALPIVRPTTTIRGWQVCAFGILWGVGASAMESVVLPLRDDGWADLGWVLAWIIPGWSVIGIGVAFAVEWAGTRIHRPRLAAAWLTVCAVGLSACWSLLYALASVGEWTSGISKVFPGEVNPFAAYLYQTWVVVFYGGFYFIAWQLNHQAERSRELLARSELARLDAGTSIAAAHLQILRGRVEPELLLRVIAKAERRYASDAAAAERLLALLVAFLRRAMPALRTGRSTLEGELALARAYDELCADLERRPTSWSISGTPAAGLSFPPLLLLPLLDELRASCEPPFSGRVSVASEAQDTVIRFFGGRVRRDDWISPALDYRLRVDFSTWFGQAWTRIARRTDDANDPALVLIVGVQAAAPAAAQRAHAQLWPS